MIFKALFEVMFFSPILFLKGILPYRQINSKPWFSFFLGAISMSSWSLEFSAGWRRLDWSIDLESCNIPSVYLLDHNKDS